MHQALSLLVGTPKRNLSGWRGLARGTTMSARTSPSAKHYHGGNGQDAAARQGVTTNPCGTKPCGHVVAKPSTVAPARAGSAVVATTSVPELLGHARPIDAVISTRGRHGSTRAPQGELLRAPPQSGRDRAKERWRRRVHDRVGPPRALTRLMWSWPAKLAKKSSSRKVWSIESCL
jgi:hypothetical protein